MFLSARDFSPNTIRAYAYDLLKLMTFLESRGWSVQDFTPARAVEFLRGCVSRRHAAGDSAMRLLR